MAYRMILFWCAAFVVFLIDQDIKQTILDGFRWESACISIVLVYNKGVAFSMFSAYADYLKYVQCVLLTGIALYVHFDRALFMKYYFPVGMLVGAGIGNVADRFIHDGVVDYVYWHCGFDFAIFNFADVMINVSVGLILLIAFFPDREETRRVSDGERDSET